MENIAIKHPGSQEEKDSNFSYVIEGAVPGGKEFFDILEKELRELARITIVNVIRDEFDKFIGAAPYKRSDSRNDYRNGVRHRSLETRFGMIEGILVPRARNSGFITKLFRRWNRREKKVTRLLADLFINGISTRKVKKISKALYGKSYSASTVSRCNRMLQEEYLQWMNRPIKESIRYLFLDAVNLKIRRHWISKESLLCAIGITEDGKKEFLGFLLGGRESTKSWENLLLLLINRGLSAEHLKLIIVDGNSGLLSALDSLFPSVPVQRCIVHKIRNVVGKCPKTLRGIIPAEFKQIIYATSRQEALELFDEFKNRWNVKLPQIVECIEKDIEELLAFYKFPYQHWVKIRSTNVIERAFKEFRRRVKVMETFPNEKSCLKIMFSLAKMLNENWEFKPIKDF